uniref:DDA1 domain-containing protein n=1 Tax=Panagrellus redivivus TaxID=6233 RepID=A0A7E4UUG8_PANRE
MTNIRPIAQTAATHFRPQISQNDPLTLKKGNTAKLSFRVSDFAQYLPEAHYPNCNQPTQATVSTRSRPYCDGSIANAIDKQLAYSKTKTKDTEKKKKRKGFQKRR